MDNNQRDYFLAYLHDLEDKSEATRSELRRYAEYKHISVGSITSIASELALLETEQRAICFTLNHLGYYTVYEDGHAKDIVPLTKE